MLLFLLACLITPNKESDSDTQDTDIENEDDSGTVNQPPTLTVSFSLSTLYLYDSLTCIVTAEDVEDGEMSVEIEWFQNTHLLSSTGNELFISSDDMSIDDELTCRATTTDTGGLSATEEASITIEAKPIAIDTVSVDSISGSEDIFNDDSVICSVSTSAPEDNPILSYVWKHNDVTLNESLEQLNLSAVGVFPEDKVTCEVIAETIYGGMDMASAERVIDNRPPLEPSITITPSAPRAGEDVVCSAENAVDPDGEAIQGVVIQWVNGAITVSGNTLVGSQTVGGDIWFCEAYAEDGHPDGSGAMASQSVEILPECTYESLGTTQITLSNSEIITFQLIPGCDDPLNRYQLSNDFYMMTTEVTQGMFDGLLNDNPVGPQSSYGYGAEYPAYYVDWHVAAEFANELTLFHNATFGTSLQQCYSCVSSGVLTCSYAMSPYLCDGYSLPTSAEWEYAARAGTIDGFWTGDGATLGGSESELYGCGNGSADTTILIEDFVGYPPLSHYAWFCGNEDDQNYTGTAKPVGLKAPNGFGLYDMHGNINEWVTDDTTQSFANVFLNPVSMGTASQKILRGGNYWGYPINVRSDYMVPYSGTVDSVGNGFRLRRMIP